MTENCFYTLCPAWQSILNLVWVSISHSYRFLTQFQRPHSQSRDDFVVHVASTARTALSKNIPRMWSHFYIGSKIVNMATWTTSLIASLVHSKRTQSRVANHTHFEVHNSESRVVLSLVHIPQPGFWFIFSVDTPIILVPSAISALINLSNAQELLEHSRWVKICISCVVSICVFCTHTGHVCERLFCRSSFLFRFFFISFDNQLQNLDPESEARSTHIQTHHSSKRTGILNGNELVD